MTPLRLFAAICILGFAFGSGFLVRGWLFQSSPQADLLTIHAYNARSSEPQIEDAIRRYAGKLDETEQSVREYHQPRVMFIPTRNQGDGLLCIELHLKPGHLGGSPVYCYQSQTVRPEEGLKLMAEFTEVE